MKHGGFLVAALATLVLLGCARPIQRSGTGQPAAPKEAAGATGWDGAACHESPVVATFVEPLTGRAVTDRDGGMIVARMPALVAGQQSKVLWRPKNGYHEASLRITAERLDAPGPPAAWSFLHATYDRAGTIDAGYPSGIGLPTPGCWRLTAHLGSTDASVTVYVGT